MTPFDVAVVGAGPAGAVAAREVSRHGGRVVLLDRAHFPRPKVCGCCLNRHALSALRAAGLGELPEHLGAVSLDSITLAAGGRTAVLRLPGSVALSREAFDAALVREAERAGVEFRAGVRVQLDVADADGWQLTGGDEPLRAKVVIDATGLNGRLTDTAHEVRSGSRIGAGVVLDSADGYRPHTIYMATGGGGYVGLVRLEDGRLDVAAAFDAGFVRQCGGLGEAADRIVSGSGLPPLAGLKSAHWKGTPPLTQRPRTVAGPRWFAVGDAAGYVEPFTGEGMAWAVAGAVAVAPLAVRGAKNWDDRLRAEWAAGHRRLIGRRQLACRVVARGLRSPFVCRWAVRVLARVPSLSGPVVRSLNRPYRGSP